MTILFPAGEFNQRIQLEAESAARSALNEPVGAWTVKRRLWARVRPVNQRELAGADQASPSASYLFVVRNSAALKDATLSAQRIRWQDDLYYIIGQPLKLDGGLYLQILAASGVNHAV